MSSNAIGGYQFATMEGTLAPPGIVSEIFEPPPGWGGYTVRLLGPRSKPVTVRTTTLCSGTAGVATAKLNYAALQGTLVTVYDAMGNSQVGVLVVDQTSVSEVAVSNFASGSLLDFTITHILTMDWVLLYPYGG